MLIVILSLHCFTQCIHSFWSVLYPNADTPFLFLFPLSSFGINKMGNYSEKQVSPYGGYSIFEKARSTFKSVYLKYSSLENNLNCSILKSLTAQGQICLPHPSLQGCGGQECSCSLDGAALQGSPSSIRQAKGKLLHWSLLEFSWPSYSSCLPQ